MKFYDLLQLSTKNLKEKIDSSAQKEKILESTYCKRYIMCSICYIIYSCYEYDIWRKKQ